MSKPKVNQSLLDAWSLVHIGVGYLFGRLSTVNPAEFTLINGGYEIFEQFLKEDYDIFNVPWGRGTVYESTANSVMDFFITEAGYFLGYSQRMNSLGLNSDMFRAGMLHSRNVHTLLAQVAGASAGFTTEEVDTLEIHITDPDDQDTGVDRLWNHFFDVLSMSGGAPSAVDLNYRLAVNHNDLVYLAKASHYLTDISCVYHTTYGGQENHLWYENWTDTQTFLVYPYALEMPDVQQATVDLAVMTHARFVDYQNDIALQDMQALWLETESNLFDSVSYLTAMYRKFREDVANGVHYPIPLQIDPAIPLAIAMPFLIVASKPEYRKQKKRISDLKLSNVLKRLKP